MKIKDILGKIDNVDVYDDFTEELGIAYCATTLTPAGTEKFADVLELDCNITGCCSESNYKKYFNEEVANV